MERLGGTCVNHGCKPTKACARQRRGRPPGTTCAAYGGAHRPGDRGLPGRHRRVHRIVEDRSGRSTTPPERPDPRADPRQGDVGDGSDRRGASRHVGARTLTSRARLPEPGRACRHTAAARARHGRRPDGDRAAGPPGPAEHLVVVGAGYIGLGVRPDLPSARIRVTIVAGSGRRRARGRGRLPHPDRDARGRGRADRPGRTERVAQAGGGIEVTLSDGGVVTGSHLLMAVGSARTPTCLGRARPSRRRVFRRRTGTTGRRCRASGRSAT
jgi:hypothetical protein